MRSTDLLFLALNSLKEKKTRSILTILGIVIGPLIVIAMAGTIAGFSAYFTNLILQTYSPNDIFLSPKSGTLSSYLIYQIQQVPGVQVVVPYYLIPATIQTPKGPMPTSIFSMNPNYVSVVLPSAKPYIGTLPPPNSYTETAVGYYIANPQYPGQPTFKPGQLLTVNVVMPNGQTKIYTFYVVGALNEISSFGGADFDKAIYVSDAFGRSIYGDQYSGAIVVTKSPSVVNSTATIIKEKFGNYVQVETIQQFLTFLDQSLASFQLLLVIAGSSSFVVAFIAVVTTMLTSVVERTREIGLLVSLGFTKRQIMGIFVVEAAAMGVIGSLIGSALGVAGSYAISSLASAIFMGPFGHIEITPQVTLSQIAEVDLTMIILTTIAGLIPAYRATKIEPAKALRYEV